LYEFQPMGGVGVCEPVALTVKTVAAARRNERKGRENIAAGEMIIRSGWGVYRRR
jgi:hypothetical protein